MAQSLKQLKTRIRSVEGIHKMTRAMEMVSSAKLRSLQKKFLTAHEYFSKMDSILSDLLSGCGDSTHGLILPKTSKQKIFLCVVTSDTGLCGNYNSAVMHKAEEFIRKNSGKDLRLVVVGKKGMSHFKRSGLPIESSYTQGADKLADELMDKFLKGFADEIYICYTDFESASRHKPVLEKLLEIEKKKTKRVEFLAEPGAGEILNKLLPLYVRTKIRIILLGALTAEHSTRIMAMHEATDNAKELWDDLVLLRNKMRQEKITSEIIEVISSVGAMKE